MIKRDFSNESYANVFFRAFRAFRIRLRGRFYYYAGVFNSESSSDIVIGSNSRILNGKWILLNRKSAFSDNCRLECYAYESGDNSVSAKIVIGENTSFGDMAHIGAINRISIGKNVLAGSKVLIIDHDHGPGGKNLRDVATIAPRNRTLISKGPIIIGDNVWIGEGVIILAGSDIGDGSIIAANTVVRGKVEPYTVFYNKNKII